MPTLLKDSAPLSLDGLPYHRPAASAPQLREVIALLSSRRTFVLALLAIGVAGGIVANLVMPDVFESTTVLMPPQQSQSALMAMIGSGAGISALGAGAKDLGFRNPADIWVGILGGSTIADTIIAKVKLKEVYKLDTTEETRKELAKKTTLEARKDTLIRITVQDHDAQRAAEIANAYVRELGAQYSRLTVGEAAQRRQFFESRIKEEKESLSAAEAGLRGTQEKTGAYQLTGQVESTIRSIAQLQAEIAGKQVMLRRLSVGATDENPEVIRQESELKALRSQLAALESGSSSQGGHTGALASSRVPAATLEYIRSLRDFKYHETLFDLLSKQYEAARIDEDKQAPALQVVDKAIPADYRSGPPRALIVLFGGIAGLLAAVSWVLLMNWWGTGRTPSQAALQYNEAPVF